VSARKIGKVVPHTRVTRSSNAMPDVTAITLSEKIHHSELDAPGFAVRQAASLEWQAGGKSLFCEPSVCYGTENEQILRTKHLVISAPIGLARLPSQHSTV